MARTRKEYLDAVRYLRSKGAIVRVPAFDKWTSEHKRAVTRAEKILRKAEAKIAQSKQSVVAVRPPLPPPAQDESENDISLGQVIETDIEEEEEEEFDFTQEWFNDGYGWEGEEWNDMAYFDWNEISELADEFEDSYEEDAK